MVYRLGLVSASVIAIALAHPALAQDAEGKAPSATDQPANGKDAAQKPGKDSNAIAEIVVSATRQATNLQDTPIAITAVTSEALEARGITTMGELTSVVPNAQFRRVQGAFGPGISAYIRGIGSTDTGLGADNPGAF
jgi:iron complex outermembrane receptor protein